MTSGGTSVERLVDYEEGYSGPVGYAAAFSPDGEALVAAEDGHGPYPYLAITNLFSSDRQPQACSTRAGHRRADMSGASPSPFSATGRTPLACPTDRASPRRARSSP
jgi:hypothetical protein